MKSTRYHNPHRSTEHTAQRTRNAAPCVKAARPEVDPAHVIRSHCGRHPHQEPVTIKEIHEFDLGWIAEMVDADGRDASVRFIVTRNGKIAAMAGWVSLDTNIYQFMRRPGVQRDDNS